MIDMKTEKQIPRKSMMSRASRSIPKRAILSTVCQSFMPLLQCSPRVRAPLERGGGGSPSPTARCRYLVRRHCGVLLEGWKSCILHFKRLHHWQAFDVLVDDLNDFGIELAVISLGEFLVLPQADGDHFRLVGRKQHQLIEETLLPAEQGKNFLFNHLRKLWRPVLLDLHRNVTAKHKSSLIRAR